MKKNTKFDLKMNCSKQTLNTKWCHYGSVRNMFAFGLAGLWLISSPQPLASTLDAYGKALERPFQYERSKTG